MPEDAAEEGRGDGSMGQKIALDGTRAGGVEPVEQRRGGSALEKELMEGLHCDDGLRGDCDAVEFRMIGQHL